MADDSNSEPEVFEITDFTTASEWERFIAKLEEAIRSWNLDMCHKDDNITKKSKESRSRSQIEEEESRNAPLLSNSTKVCSKQSNEGDWNIQTSHLSFADFDFTLSYHALQTAKTSSNAFPKDCKKEHGKDDLHDHPPVSMMDMFDFDFDFPHRAHCIARWNGVKAFMVLSPSNIKEDINTESRSKLLLSSAAVALSNTNCEIPMFIQVQQRWRRLFFGICMGNGFHASYEMAHLKSTPPQCQNISGLLDVFKAKLAVPPRLIPPITVSVRFTYVLNWAEDDWVQQPPDLNLHFGTEVGYLKLSRLPFGPLQDPISELHLATTWPCLSEETVVDDNEFSDLNPVEAPKWSIRAKSAENCCSLLYDHLNSFLQLCKSSESTQQIIRSLSRDELVSDQHGSLSQAFEKLTEAVILQSQGRLSSSEKTARREQMKLQESPLPEDLLNMILFHLFPDSHEETEERQKILAEEQRKIEEDGKRDRFRTLKSAPEKSMVSLLTICLCIVNNGYGGMKAFAHLWHEFILELRYRYENNTLIPRVALEAPNFNYCLIHQKLQMLNYCIQRKRERYEQSSKPVSTSSSSASLQARPASPSSINKLELPGSPKETKWVVDTMDSGSDDEFFEAVEEQERVLQSSANEEMDIALQKDSISESPSGSFMSLNRSATDIVLERTGVLKETEMLLLETNEPLCIPITQEQPPLTEDIIEEQTQIMLQLGRSEGGSKYLAQMQCGSLFSDVQAFKAANPGCIFEDFVRWYSPNDWIPGRETLQEKQDVAKLKADYQKETEKAELKEVVGSEEIDGWDLDADEQINENDLMEVDPSLDEENQPKWIDEGHLSVRMRIPGNIWLETWQTANAVPVRRQKRLFDDTKEAEKVLHFLANLKPSEIVTHLFPVSIHSSINRLLLEDECSRPRISNIINQIVHDTTRLAHPTKDSFSNMMNISRKVQIAELAISRIQFLERQFNKLSGLKEGESISDDIAEFVSDLLSLPEVNIAGGPRGKIGKMICKLIKDQQCLYTDSRNETGGTLSEVIREKQMQKNLTFPPPAGREYILRTTVSVPRESSRPSPQRLFTVITPEEFRLAGVFTRDTTFI